MNAMTLKSRVERWGHFPQAMHEHPLRPWQLDRKSAPKWIARTSFSARSSARMGHK
jgi:hypothetical protein